MTVTLNQYRRTVGVFNNRKILLKKTHGPFLQKNILINHLIQAVIILIVLTVRYVTSFSFKIINNQSPRYLFQLVPSLSTRNISGNSENIPQLRTKHDFFRNSIFPSTIKEGNNLDPQIRKSKSISIFKSNILKFIRPKPNNVYYCHNPKGI